MPDQPDPAAPADIPASFEDALAQIETLTSRMERQDIPLEELIVAYERGLRLVKHCNERLDAVEERLMKIARNSAGQPAGIEPAGEEIQPSTPPPASGTKDKSPNPGNPPIRLY